MCLCGALTRDSPRALWVLSPCPVLFPGAMPMRTCSWSWLESLQEIRASKILKCLLSVFTFPRFSSFPTLKRFPWQFNYLWNTCHTSHLMAPSRVKAKWLSLRLWLPKSKSSTATAGCRKFRTLQGGYAHNLENAQNLLTFSSHLYSVEEIKKEHRVTE